MKKLSFRNDILPLKDKLFRLALRITMQREDAEDVVQDTMIKLWKQQEKLQQVDSIEAYSLTVCRNLAIDHTRKAANNVVELSSDNIDQRSENPYSTIFLREQLSQVETIIAQLPEKQRTCFQLRDIEGKTYREIAGILSITEDQVKINIFRARKTIRERISEQEQA